MAVQVDISKYFTSDSIGQLLKDSAPVRTPMWARVFGNVKQHPLPHISKRTMVETTGNVPLVKRGTASIGVNDGEEISDLYEPQPIAVNTVMKAMDFVNLKSIGTVSAIETYLADKLNGLRNRIFNTIEALCIQAMTGTINYSIKVYDGDLGNYKVSFGNTIQPSAYVGFVGNWATAKLEDIFSDLMILESAITERTMYGSKIGILAGRKAFFTLVGKAKDTNTSSTMRMVIDQKTVNFNGVVIEYFGDAGYTDLVTGNKVKAIDDNEILLFAEDAPFSMNYLAIDDFDAAGNAQMIARPIFTKEIKQEDPSARKLLAMSKPFPMPVTSCILRVRVIN